MKFITKPKLIAFLLVIVSSMLILYACRKIEYSRENKNENHAADQFLKVPANVPASIKRIAQKIKEQNEEHEFIGRLTKEVGIPNWDKSVVIFPPSQIGSAAGGTEVNGEGGDGIWGSDTLAFIPLGKPGESWISSFMACLVGDSNKVVIRLARGDRYPAYGMTRAMDTISAELIALQCMYLEYIASDYKDSLYRVNDLRLFKWDRMSSGNASRFIKFKQEEEEPLSGGNTVNVMVSPGIPCFGVSYMEWYNVMGYYPPEGTPNQTYLPGTYCINYDLWLDYVLNGPGSSTSISGEEAGNGGGGDDWYDEDVCRVMPGQDPCGGVGSGGGWTVVSEPENPYNPDIYDSVGVSNYLKDNFPCAYKFIMDSLPNANWIAQIAGSNVFSDQAYCNLTFDTSATYTTASQPSAHALYNPYSVSVDDDNITRFSATIHLNPWHLKNATKEYMISTIIHEAMHVIFGLRWGQYQKWLQYGTGNVDSNFIKAHFPIHWYYITGQNVPLSDMQDHEMMATDYSQMHQDLVRPFFNPAAPASIRDSVLKAMTYCGLLKTTAWSLLPNQGVDTCKYRGIQITAERAALGDIYPPGCSSSYHYHFSNDLKMRKSCN